MAVLFAKCFDSPLGLLDIVDFLYTGLLIFNYDFTFYNLISQMCAKSEIFIRFTNIFTLLIDN